MATGHIGSWGLPDFGITEAVGGLFGSGLTAQGGSNVMTGSGMPTAQVPTGSGSYGSLQGPGYGWGGTTDTYTPNAGIPSVQGATSAAGGSGGGGDSAFQQLSKMDRNPDQERQYQEYLRQMGQQTNNYNSEQRNSINKGWDAYTGQLNDMLNIGLPGQKSAQEQIAQNTLTQGVNDLGAQRSQSESAVTSQQAKSLKDLSDNVRNLFQSGNIYLGARGAGDSSAANQYSYAITKEGTKNRGDIMSQANARINQIGDIYNQETNRLKTETSTRMAQIAEWFNGAQNQIRQSIGQAGLGREKDIQALSTNIYNQALQAMQQLQAETSNRRASLESWAMSNSKNVQELMGNMQAAQQMPGFGGISNGMPQVTAEGNMFVPTGYGANTQKKDIFGNPIG